MGKTRHFGLFIPFFGKYNGVSEKLTKNSEQINFIFNINNYFYFIGVKLLPNCEKAILRIY